MTAQGGPAVGDPWDPIPNRFDSTLPKAQRAAKRSARTNTKWILLAEPAHLCVGGASAPSCMHEKSFGFSRGVWVREHCTLQIAKAAAAQAANQKQLQTRLKPRLRINP